MAKCINCLFEIVTFDSSNWVSKKTVIFIAWFFSQKVISKDGRAKMLYVRFYLKLHWAALENIIFDKKHIKLEKSSISWRGVLVWIKIWTFLFRIIRLVLVAFRLYSKFTSRVWYCPLRWTVDRHTLKKKKVTSIKHNCQKLKHFTQFEMMVSHREVWKCGNRNQSCGCLSCRGDDNSAWGLDLGQALDDSLAC